MRPSLLRACLALGLAAAPARGSETPLAAVAQAPLAPPIAPALSPAVAVALPPTALPTLSPVSAAAAPGPRAALHTKLLVVDPDRDPHGIMNDSGNTAGLSAEAGRPFDRSGPRPAEVDFADYFASAGVPAAAVFTPAGTVSHRRDSLVVLTERIAPPAEARVGVEKVRQGRFERQLGSAVMETVSSQDGGHQRVVLGSAAQTMSRLALSANGAMAAWSTGGALWFYDLEADRVVARHDLGVRAVVRRLTLSDAGASAAYVVQDGHSLRLESLDLASGKAVELPLRERTNGLAAAGGQVAVLTHDGELLIWEPLAGRTRRFLVPGKTEYNLPLAFSPDGRTLAVGNDHGEVFLFEVDAYHPTRTLLNRATAAPATVLQWSGDGTVLLGADDNAQVAVYDLANRQVLKFDRPRALVHALAWDRETQTPLWAEADGLRRITRLGERASELSQLRLPTAVYAAALSRDGAIALAAFRGDDEAELRLLRLRESPARRAAAQAAARAAALDAERRRLLSEKRAELMAKTETADPLRLVPRLRAYASDSLEIFRHAGRKWLVELASLGDDDAVAALTGVSAADKAAAAKAAKK